MNIRRSSRFVLELTDKWDWRIKAVETLHEVTPPILLRKIRQLKNRSISQ